MESPIALGEQPPLCKKSEVKRKRVEKMEALTPAEKELHDEKNRLSCQRHRLKMKEKASKVADQLLRIVPYDVPEVLDFMRQV